MDNTDRPAPEQHDPFAEANAALRESLAALAAGADLDTFVGHLLSAIERHTRGRCAALFLHDPAARTLRMRWATLRGVPAELSTDPLFEVWRRDVPEDLTPGWGLIRESTTPLFENDLRDPNTWPFSVPWHEALGHQAFVCVPLGAGGRCLGFLAVAFDRPAADLSRTLVELTQALAQHATLALELTRLADATRDAAIAREREVAAEGRAAELARANEVLQGSIAALARAPALDRVLGELLQQAALHSRADFLYFWRFDPAADTLSLEYGVAEGRPHDGWSLPAPEYFREPTPAAAVPGWAESLRTRALTLYEPVGAGDGRLCPGMTEFVRAQGIQVIANAALVAGDRPFGYLGLAFRRADALTPGQLRLVESLAAQATLALQLTRLAEEARLAAVADERERAANDRAAELVQASAALRRTIDIVATEAELDAVLGHVLQAVTEQLNALSSTLWLYNPGTATPSLKLVFRDGTVRPATADDDPDAVPPVPLDLTHTHLAELILKRQPYLVDDLEANTVLTPEQRAAFLAQGVRALLAVPLATGTEPIGSLSVRLNTRGPLAAERLELAQALANQATLAVQLTRLAKKAEAAAVAEERNRMAREIHDTLAQCFTGILMQLQAAGEFAGSKPDVASACVGRAEDLARDGLREARRSVTALRPEAAEYSDLAGVLTRLARRATADTPVPATVRLSGEAYLVPPDVGLNLMRIAQEALGNAQRYAEASRIRIEVEYEPHRVTLRVSDDGRGFDPAGPAEDAGFGLTGMRQRAERIGGEFTFTTAPGRGTEVLVRVPAVPWTEGV